MKIDQSLEKNKGYEISSSIHSEVFISYAVANRDLAMRIHKALESAGQSVWIDSDDIRYADNWKDAVLPAIEQATVILFITSKASIVSKNCLEELEYAELMGKRIIPIVAERVDSELVPDNLRERVRRDFRDPENFHNELLKLIQDITSEPEYVQTHTHLASRAARWHNDQLGLLDSGEIKQATKWLEWARSHPNLEPRPTKFITDFIKASRDSARNRQIKLTSLFLVIVIAIGIYFGIQWWNSIPRSGIRVQLQGDETTKTRTVEGVARLNQYLDVIIPDKSDRQRLLIATWNIRTLGKGQRPDEALHYIAEIISHFDIVAIQEIQGDSGDYKRVLEILGPGWKSLESDVNEGSMGSQEQLAFLYDSRKLTPNGLVGELVLSEGLPNGRQPTRSPYFVGFTFENNDIVFCNAHIVFGDMRTLEDRVLEIDAIAQQLARKVDRGREFPPNLVLLGDVQGGTVNGQILEAIEGAGFILPPEIRDLPTIMNSDGGIPYDQIALILSPKFRLNPSASGVIDYYQFVYTNNQVELYQASDEELATNEELAIKKFTRQRSYWMSDHLPKWLSIQVIE